MITLQELLVSFNLSVLVHHNKKKKEKKSKEHWPKALICLIHSRSKLRRRFVSQVLSIGLIRSNAVILCVTVVSQTEDVSQLMRGFSHCSHGNFVLLWHARAKCA